MTDATCTPHKHHAHLHAREGGQGTAKTAGNKALRAEGGGGTRSTRWKRLGNCCVLTNPCDEHSVFKTAILNSCAPHFTHRSASHLGDLGHSHGVVPRSADHHHHLLALRAPGRSCRAATCSCLAAASRFPALSRFRVSIGTAAVLMLPCARGGSFQTATCSFRAALLTVLCLASRGVAPKLF